MLLKTRAEQNKFICFLCRVHCKFANLFAELLKKLVKNNGFWKNNAIRHIFSIIFFSICDTYVKVPARCYNTASMS